MNQDKENIIINVGRQIGSGGRVIATMLAKDFDCQFYDKEILNLAAQESGFSKEFFEQMDEHKGFLRSFIQQHAPFVTDTTFYRSQFSQESLFKFQSDAIRKAAEQGSCVFVGRCADYVLRDMPNTVNIFVTARLEFRVAQVCKRHNLDEEAALKHLQSEEAARASFYNYYTGKKWGQAANYDLCVDASLLGLEETEQLIASFIRKRFNL